MNLRADPVAVRQHLQLNLIALRRLGFVYGVAVGCVAAANQTANAADATLQTTGDRMVFEVTNLNDKGPGSFRAGRWHLHQKLSSEL